MLFNNKTATSSIKITPIPSNSKLFLYFFHANLILFFFYFHSILGFLDGAIAGF